ncbi:MAG: rhomboid family intramembrane serine protease [Flavobacterium sp.]|nr:rhomboid family intramembrane serine protease [Flavobacterium sp.]
MIVSILVLILATVLISYKGIQDSLFFRKNEFHIGSIQAGEQFRMLSSGFLHADFQHLFFNMFTLYLFAPYVVFHFGNFYFFVLYFGGLIAGSLLTLYFHKSEYQYRAVGASGAVTGIIYSAILIEPNIYMYGFMPGYVFGFLYLILSIYGMKTKKDNIGHVAHFGGAIGGFVITLIKEPQLLSLQPLTVAALLIPIVVLFFLEKTNKL